MDSQVKKVFFSFIGNALFKRPLDMVAVAGLDVGQWGEVYRLAARQAVLAILYDVVAGLPAEYQPPRDIRIQWALSTENIDNRSRMQRARARQISDIWVSAGLRPVILKGMGLGRYYPNPDHRECGDFDCFLGKDAKRGDDLAARNGAEVEKNPGYKHSLILYKGLVIENHRFCIGVRGSEATKQLERHLEDLLDRVAEPEYLPDTRIVVPSADFTALFVTYHSLNHFISEGIKVRHLCDWACFVGQEQNNIDWPAFYAQCERYHLRRFADAATDLAVKYLGLEVVNPAITIRSPYAERVLASIFDDDASVHSAGKGLWWHRYKLLSNIWQFRWKYRDIYQRHYLRQMSKLALGFVFDRHPKI